MTLARRMVVAATVVLMLATTPGWAAGTLDTVKSRDTLIVGVKADFPPFGFMDEAGQRAGYDIDIAREIARVLLGSVDKVRFVTVTSANRIPMLQTNQVDIIIATMTTTAARKEVIDFSVPYFCSGHLILTKASNSSIGKFADLDGLQVATVQGSTGDRVTLLLAPQAKRVTFGQNSEALLALKDGRVAAFVQDDVLLLAFAKQDPSLKVAGWPPQMPGPYGMGLRKGDKDLLGAINVSLAQIRAKGTYDKLFDKWFGAVARNLLAPKACPAELVLP